MKRWSLNVHAPRLGHFGTFSLIGLKWNWCRYDAPSNLGGWVSVQVALLGFSAALTYWRGA
ncbi:hypothetical protein [Noviluteimonas gilva]|uniref:Uncharacterized protein n=1 Tax=Noviluteimonas gilva TaxID=2682097 RepID=A0A7C9LWF8_9GAMM|nr:hypothetical protein [Lysobacter gilvus]MUV13565.1 hypothetical protein [Lysobacter gilvus]